MSKRKRKGRRERSDGGRKAPPAEVSTVTAAQMESPGVTPMEAMPADDRTDEVVEAMRSFTIIG